MSFVWRWLMNSVALWGTTMLFPQWLSFNSDALVTVLWAGLIMALLNAFVRPVLTFFGFPLVVLSLGLFLWVIQAGLLFLVAAVSGLEVFGWAGALLGSLVLSILNLLLEAVLKPRQALRAKH